MLNCTRCGKPVYGSITAHPCCVLHDAQMPKRPCPACATSAHLNNEQARRVAAERKRNR